MFLQHARSIKGGRCDGGSSSRGSAVRRMAAAGAGAAARHPYRRISELPAAQDYQRQLAAFLDGLAEAGYVDGRNVKIEYRWAENHSDRLPALMADVWRRSELIAATSTPAALAAKAAKTTIPIVFETGFDPIQLGLVTSLNKPSENITGVTQLNAFVTPKRLELLHELVPKAEVVGLLVNPANPALMEAETNGAMSAARSFSITLHVLHASNEGDFEGLCQAHRAARRWTRRRRRSVLYQQKLKAR